MTLELITGNAVEPWLYGNSTGMSPVAVLVAATFWTWLWGGVGLLLSTPLTVCIVVLGRYVPQLEFLNTLLGDEPVLPQDARLYQRSLAADKRKSLRSSMNIWPSIRLPNFTTACSSLRSTKHKPTRSKATSGATGRSPFFKPCGLWSTSCANAPPGN